MYKSYNVMVSKKLFFKKSRERESDDKIPKVFMSNLL